jgi:hypothetical protein
MSASPWPDSSTVNADAVLVQNHTDVINTLVQKQRGTPSQTVYVRPGCDHNLQLLFETNPLTAIDDAQVTQNCRHGIFDASTYL